MPDSADIYAANKVQQRIEKNWMTTWIRETIHDFSQWKAADKATRKAMDGIASARMYKWLAETKIWDDNRAKKDPNNGSRPREHDASTEALKLALDLPGVPNLLQAIETLRLKRKTPSRASKKKAARSRASRKKTLARASRKMASPVRASRKSARLSTKSPVASTPADDIPLAAIVVNFHPSPEPIVHKATGGCFPLSSPPKVSTPPAAMVDPTPSSSPIANPTDGSEVPGPLFSRVFTPPPAWYSHRSPSRSPPTNLAYDSDATEVPTRDFTSPPRWNDPSPSSFLTHPIDRNLSLSYTTNPNAKSCIAPSRRNGPSRSPSPPSCLDTNNTDMDDDVPQSYHEAASIFDHSSLGFLLAPTPNRPSPAAFLTNPAVSSASVTSEETQVYVSPYGTSTRPFSQRATSPPLLSMARSMSPGDRQNATRVSTTPAGSMRLASPYQPPPAPFSPPRSRRSVAVANTVSDPGSPQILQSASWVAAPDPESTRSITDSLQNLEDDPPLLEYEDSRSVASISRPVDRASAEPYVVAEARGRIDDHFVLGYDINTSSNPAPTDIRNRSYASVYSEQKKKRAGPSYGFIIDSSDEEDEECHTPPRAPLSRELSPTANPPPSQYLPALEFLTSPPSPKKRRKVRFSDINEEANPAWEDVEERAEEFAPVKQPKSQRNYSINKTNEEQDIDDEDEVPTKPIKKSKSKAKLKTYSKVKSANGVPIPEGVTIPSGHRIVRRDGWKEGPPPTVKPKKRRLGGELGGEVKKRKMSSGDKGKKDAMNPFLNVDWDALEEKSREEETLKDKGKGKEQKKVDDEVAPEEDDQVDDMER